MSGPDNKIHIYNSLTRRKELFAPLNPPLVNMYTCGVTVYDDCHIGHARSLYIFEVMRRYLEYRGYKVNFVRNITDIDDKIINRANELKSGWKELVEKYIAAYRDDLNSLGVRSGLVDDDGQEPRATKSIADIIKYISSLIDKGYAYATSSGVYFSVRGFKEYGKLSGQSVDEMLTGVRKDTAEEKADPLDFALWKASKTGEPSWESPWGQGRPGWHIECSVMSTKYLKTDTLDIHAGGRDLIFPHHENEIAQSEAYSGKPFAKYWIHHGLLTINGQKMSKSLGNFVTIRDFMARYQDVNLLKLFFLSAHYSSPVDYSQSKIEEIKQSVERIRIFLDKSRKMEGKISISDGDSFSDAVRVKEQFIASMDDDFNTAQALSCIFEMVSLGNKNINDPRIVLLIRRELVVLHNILGVTVKENEFIPGENIEKMIEERNQARKNRDFVLADKIRKELEEVIILEDNKDGTTTWRRKL